MDVVANTSITATLTIKKYLHLFVGVNATNKT